jgi:hypothetical protein
LEALRLATLICGTWLWGKETVTRHYQLEPFTSIDASFLYQIEVVKGTACEMELEIPEDLVNDLTIKVSKNTLYLGVTREWWRTTKNAFNKRYAITARITMPELEGVSLSNAARLFAKDGFMPDNFQIKLTGASEASIHVITHTVNVDINGASKLEMNGLAAETKAYVNGASSLKYYQETNTMDVQAGGASAVVLSGSSVSAVLKISGASSVKAFDFETEDVVVKCSGASKAEIFATNTIAVTASGASAVRVKGNPRYSKSSSTGASVIKPY